MLRNLFIEAKAAQVAAYFLIRTKGSMPLLKLMKLMYLAERRSFQAYGEGISGDRLVSMQQGPVMSITLDLMNGAIESAAGGWESWIADRAEHQISLQDDKRDSTEDDLLALSDADLAVLKQTWDEFGRLNKFQLVDYTHDHCPEWQDPEGSMIPMKPEDLFGALGFSAEQSNAYLARMQEQAAINAAHVRALR
jgi:uncharacterized phage-associated protein